MQCDVKNDISAGERKRLWYNMPAQNVFVIDALHIQKEDRMVRGGGAQRKARKSKMTWGTQSAKREGVRGEARRSEAKRGEAT